MHKLLNLFNQVVIMFVMRLDDCKKGSPHEIKVSYKI